MRLDQLLPLAAAYADLDADAQAALTKVALDGELIEDQDGLALWHARSFLGLAAAFGISDAAGYAADFDDAGALQAQNARITALADADADAAGFGYHA